MKEVKLTPEMAQMLNDVLKEMVENHDHCKECMLNHGGMCFFAYECLTHNFKYYRS